MVSTATPSIRFCWPAKTASHRIRDWAMSRISQMPAFDILQHFDRLSPVAVLRPFLPNCAC